MLNNEVAHSIQQIDSQGSKNIVKFIFAITEHVNRFLLTTTTGSFHIIDLYHGSNQPDRVATRPLDVGGPGGTAIYFAINFIAIGRWNRPSYVTFAIWKLDG